MTWKEPGMSFRVVFFKITTPITTPKIDDRIIQLLSENKKLSRSELAGLLGDITIDGVKYHLQKLKEEGRILRIGSSKGGYWKVVQ
jgi:ATP-dependent DNA helicase RecG